MTLSKWQPFQELSSIRKQMDRLFEDILSNGDREWLGLHSMGGMWTPAVELEETDKELILKAEIPGLDAKDLEVEVGEDRVTISGEHKEEQKTEDKEKNYFHSEFYYGKLKGTLDLNRVGTIGHSLGGYTSLALAGAEINTNRLQQQCPNKKITLNISLLMQCRAKNLVPQPQLADSRIKGAIAISPIVSGIFGRESLSDISIPTAIISGSEDIIAPVVQEQVYPFTWLSAKDKYLAMMIPGDHFSGSNLLRKKPDNPTIIEEFVGKRLSNGQSYIKAFTVAFIKAHVEGDSEYLSYLSASYARNISSSEIDFNVIRSLNLEPLEREYDNILPVILPTIKQ